MDGTVTFCVGGSFFTTLLDTLAKEPGCRPLLIARGSLPATRDAQGVYFIDRDPKVWPYLHVNDLASAPHDCSASAFLCPSCLLPGIPCVPCVCSCVHSVIGVQHFQLLLNFLRDGWCLLPPSPEEQQELLHEVRFHQVGREELRRKWRRCLRGETDFSV